MNNLIKKKKIYRKCNNLNKNNRIYKTRNLTKKKHWQTTNDKRQNGEDFLHGKNQIIIFRRSVRFNNNHWTFNFLTQHKKKKSIRVTHFHH